MADVKIADLLATTTVADNDLFIVEDNADTKKITKANLVTALGGIVESGSNGNGRFVKYADGTMITTQKVAFSQTITNAVGSLFSTTNQLTITFPVSFVGNAPNVSFSAEGQSVMWVSSGNATSPTTISNTYLYLLSPVIRSSAVNGTLSITAIGRWR